VPPRFVTRSVYDTCSCVSCRCSGPELWVYMSLNIEVFLINLNKCRIGVTLAGWCDIKLR
jgi:hypothetical protein